ncbi:MAG: RDD family protein, partial [Acidimicrobiales bacterium]
MVRPTVAATVFDRSGHMASVVTPEATLLQFRTAGLGSRIMARLVDLFAMASIALALNILLGPFSSSALVSIGAIILLYPMLEGRAGTTPGKKMVGLRVITVDGGPITYRQALIRSATALVEIYTLPPGGALALTSALLSPRSQRIGDVAAGTLVVVDTRTRAKVAGIWLPVGGEHEAVTVDTSRLPEQGYGLLRDYLYRYGTLRPEAREAVAEHLCAGLATIDLVKPATMSPAVFVNVIAFAHQRRSDQLLARRGGTSGPATPPGADPPPPSAPPPPATAVGAPPPLSGMVMGP